MQYHVRTLTRELNCDLSSDAGGRTRDESFLSSQPPFTTHLLLRARYIECLLITVAGTGLLPFSDAFAKDVFLTGVQQCHFYRGRQYSRLLQENGRVTIVL